MGITSEQCVVGFRIARDELLYPTVNQVNSIFVMKVARVTGTCDNHQII